MLVENPTNSVDTCEYSGTAACTWNIDYADRISCDLQDVCPNGKPTEAYLVRNDTAGSGTTYTDDYVFWATCDTRSVCCIIRDPSLEVGELGIRGYDATDELSFRYSTLNLQPLNVSGAPDPITGHMRGEGGNDILQGSRSSKTTDKLNGNGGNDDIRLFGGADYAWGESGNDYLNGGIGDDFLYGGIDDDILAGEPGEDVVNGNGGHDLICGDGIDTLDDSSGDPATYTFASCATTGSADTIDGGPGNDKIWGAGGGDTISGGTGNDKIDGGAGVNNLYGDAGEDILCDDGVNDQDVLEGGDDNDEIFHAETGSDFDATIDGGLGDNECTPDTDVGTDGTVSNCLPSVKTCPSF